MLNNIFNHIHAMGARGSSPYQFIAKMPHFDKANEEGFKKEKMDKAQAICRRLDTIKTNHMLHLNKTILNYFNENLPEAHKINLDMSKYKHYPLASPSVFGQYPAFQAFKKGHDDFLRQYDEVFSALCEIDKTKQNILKADTKEKMENIENDMIQNLDLSQYFTHAPGAGLNSPITAAPRIKELGVDLRDFLSGEPIINMLV